MQPHITVIRAEGARYKMSFESDDGTITGKVNVALPGGDDERPPYEAIEAKGEAMFRHALPHGVRRHCKQAARQPVDWRALTALA